MMTLHEGPIAREPILRQRVEERLLASILSGEMAAGTLYSAPALAARFGVSATPVREAMINLARRGLVAIEDRRGFRILGISQRDLEEIVELRAMLEGDAMEALAGRIPAQEVADLYAEADLIVRSGDEGDIDTYLTTDRRFHLRLTGLLGNTRLLDLVTDLRATTRLVGIPAIVGSPAFHDSNQEHRRLVDLLVAGDRAGARDLMRRHVRHSSGQWAGRPGDMDVLGPA